MRELPSNASYLVLRTLDVSSFHFRSSPERWVLSVPPSRENLKVRKRNSERHSEWEAWTGRRMPPERHLPVTAALGAALQVTATSFATVTVMGSRVGPAARSPVVISVSHSGSRQGRVLTKAGAGGEALLTQK